MKKQLSAGFIPYEVGDTVMMKKISGYFKIYDIRFVQYVRDCKSEFEVSLLPDKEKWINANEIQERVILKQETE